MRARDIMTSDVVTVSPETSVRDVAKLMLERRISAVFVVDDGRRILGVVSEGDLMRRPEIGTELSRSWWVGMFAEAEGRAAEFVKAHGRRAADVMSRPVVTVGEDASPAEIAGLLEERRIKRVAVARDGRLVGVVSRADLLRALASADGARETAVTDEQLRDAVAIALRRHGWIAGGRISFVVVGGVVHLWGETESDVVRDAVRVATEEVPGVSRVENHLSVIAPLRGTV